MICAKRTFSLVAVLMAAFLLETAGVTPARAQERGQNDPQERPAHRQRSRDARRDHPGRERRPGLPHGRLPGANLFRPSPEDEGPLTDAERDELLEFARQNVPEIDRWLRELRERDPQAFEQRLQQVAPRLRQLRRIFARDAELGRNIVRHSENLHRIHRARRAWRDSADDPETRQRIEGLVRRWLADNVQIEIAVLEDGIRQLEQQRAARIDAELKRLTAEDTDLAAEPEETRALVAQWHAADSDEQRATIEEALRDACSKRMDQELDRLNARVAQMRENTVEEVDSRLARFVRDAERGPRRGPDARGDRRRRGGPEDERDPKREPGRRP